MCIYIYIYTYICGSTVAEMAVALGYHTTVVIVVALL
jgi:hypothetical protein